MRLSHTVLFLTPVVGFYACFRLKEVLLSSTPAPLFILNSKFYLFSPSKLTALAIRPKNSVMLF